MMRYHRNRPSLAPVPVPVGAIIYIRSPRDQRAVEAGAVRLAAPWIVEAWHPRIYHAARMERGRWTDTAMAGGHLATVRCLALRTAPAGSGLAATFLGGVMSTTAGYCDGCDQDDTPTRLYDVVFEGERSRVRYCDECALAARGGYVGAPWCGQPADDIEEASC